MFDSISSMLGGWLGGVNPQGSHMTPAWPATGQGQAGAGAQGGFMNGLKGMFGMGGQDPGIPGAPPVPGVQMGGQQINVPGQAWGFGNEANAVHQAVQPQMAGMMPPQAGAASKMDPNMLMALGKALMGDDQQQPRPGGGGFANQGGINPSSLLVPKLAGMAGPVSDQQRMAARSLAQSRLNPYRG